MDDITTNGGQTTELLNKIYYNPKGGFGGLNDLFKKVKAINPNIKLGDVKDYLSRQENKQILKKRPVKEFYPILSYYPFTRCQIDILDLNSYIPRNNGGYRYLFLLIDIYSRYVYGFPLKTKTETEILNGFKEILNNIEETGFRINRLDSDNESSFKSINFKNLCKSHSITQNFNNPDDHKALAFVDRLSRTIRELIASYTIAYDTTNWVKVIYLLIESYNERTHRTTGYSPKDVVEKNIEIDQSKEMARIDKVGELKYNREEYNIGDKVRLRKRRGIFDKGTEIWTKSIHTILKIERNNIYVNDRENPYNKSDLLKVGEVNIYQPKEGEQKRDEAKRDEEIRDDKKEKTIKRRIRKEGIEKNEEASNRPNGRMTVRNRKPTDTGFNIKY